MEGHSSIYNTPRYQIFAFYKRFRLIAFYLSTCFIFLFAFSWIWLLSTPFSYSTLQWFFLSVLCLLISGLCAYYSFPKIQYRGATPLIALRKGESLYEQIETRPRLIYHMLLLVLLLFVIDIFVLLGQFLQLKDSFLQDKSYYLIIVFLRYLLLIIGLTVYIMVYKKKFPQKVLYSPLLLS